MTETTVAGPDTPAFYRQDSRRSTLVPMAGIGPIRRSRCL